MADNVAVTPGTGATFATDDIGGIQYPRVKISQGADGAATDVSSAAPLNVTLANGSLPVGTNNIGDVDVLTLPALVAGTANIGDVDVLTVITGTGATNLGKAIDSAAGATDTGVAILAIRDDALSTLTPAEGDYSPLRVASTGGLHITGAAIETKLDTLNTTMTDATIPLVAHGAVDSGDPLKIGAKATASVSGATMVDAADRTDLFAGIDGVIITRPHTNLEDIVTNVVTCTAGANTSAIAAQGSGIKFYATSVIIRNAGTANGNLLLTDGSGGTTKADIPFPASTGTVFNPPVPLPFSANTAVFADPSGSDNIIVTLIGFKSKV